MLLLLNYLADILWFSSIEVNLTNTFVHTRYNKTFDTHKAAGYSIKQYCLIQI